MSLELMIWALKCARANLTDIIENNRRRVEYIELWEKHGRCPEALAEAIQRQLKTINEFLLKPKADQYRMCLMIELPATFAEYERILKD